MSLRVALIVPPAPFLSIPNASPHLGVLYLASFLQKTCSSVEVDVIDLCEERNPCGIDRDYHYYCFSASTPQYLYAKEMMDQLRIQGISGRFVIGGPHVTFCYKEALEDGFDLVVIGEGEMALSKIVSERMRDGVVQGTPISDLSSIPHPAYSKINLDSYNYSFHSKRIAQIITTRGCPYSCNFCLIHRIHGKCRSRSIDDVRMEIDTLVGDYGVTGLYLVDAVFPLERQRAIEICKVLKEYGVDWVCQTRAEKVDFEMLEIMAASGCKRISYGLETATDSNLRNINKNVTLKHYVDALKMTRSAGIKTRFYIIWGLPWDNPATAEALKTFITENPPDKWHLNTFIPFPGTPYWQNPGKYGIEIVDWDFRHYYHLGKNARGSIIARNAYCSKEELEELRDVIFEYLLRLIPDERVLLGLKG